MKNRFTTTLFAGAALALSLGLSACLTDNEDDALKITSQPQSVTAAIGDSISFSVAASGGEGTIKYMWILTMGGESDTLTDTTATISTTVESDMTGLSLRAVVSDGKTSVTSNSVTVTVTYGAGDTLTLGAQGNLTVGSVIDLDSGKVWSSQVANANQAKIDLVYLYYNNIASLNGALAARDSGVKYSINLTNGYNASTVKNIQLVKVTAKPATIAAADSLYEAGTKLRSTVIVAGDKFVVKSSEDVYNYLEVRSVSASATGTAGLTLFVGELP